MHIIGLVGEKGSGKGTFVKLLAECALGKNIASVRFSDILYETLAMWGISPTRVNLQKLAVAMNEAYGDGTLAMAIAARVSKLDADIVVVEGVRWDADVALVRRLPNNVLVYVTANPQLRHERTRARGEKAGESEASFEQFIQEEQAPNEVGIPKIGASADYVIKNEGTLTEYRAAVEAFYRARL